MQDQRDRTLAVNTLLLSIGQFVPKLIAMLTLPILTTYLTKEEFGLYDLANSMVSLIVPLMTMQIQQVAFRYLVLARDRQEKTEYMTSALLFLTASSAVFFALIYLSVHLMGQYSPLQNLLICLFLISESYFRLFGQLVRGLGYNLKYSIGVVLFSLFQLLLSALLLVAVPGGVVGAFAAFTISYLIAIAYMFVSARVWQYVDLHHVSLARMWEMLRLSAPIVPSSISLWVVNLSNRFVIGGVMGLEANGIFAVANKIPNLFSMAYTTFNLAWTESATLAVEQDDKDAYYSRMTNQLIRFLTGVMLLLIALTPLLFRFFINAQYQDAYNQMPILFFGVFFSSMVSFYGAIYVAIRRTAQVGISSALGAVLNIAVNLLLIGSWGLYAASVSTAVSYMVICLYRMYDLNRVVKIRYDVPAIARAMLCFGVSAGLCYAGGAWAAVLTLALALVYNVLENGPMLLGMVKMIRRRCGRK